MDHDGTGDDKVDATRLATARRLRALHQQQKFPEPEICGWCLKRWPTAGPGRASGWCVPWGSPVWRVGKGSAHPRSSGGQARESSQFVF